MPIFDNSTQFSLHIEELAKTTREPYLTIIAEFCDENMVDYEAVASLISPTLKQKIKLQAQSMFTMPKDTTYTLDDDE